MLLSPKVTVFGQRFVGQYGFLFRHFVFQYVFHKSISVVVVINGHLTGFIKKILLCFSLQAQQAITGLIKLLRVSVLREYEGYEFTEQC